MKHPKWRGSKKLEHEEQVNFRCSKEDVERLEQLSVFYGESKASILRMLIAREHEWSSLNPSEEGKPFSIVQIAHKMAEAPSRR